MNQEIKWLKRPELHDYPAALSYLTLIYSENVAKKFVSRLKKASPVKFKAKDIFRASSLSLLGVSNSHVEADRNKIKKGEKLSQVLLAFTVIVFFLCGILLLIGARSLLILGIALSIGTRANR